MTTTENNNGADSVFAFIRRTAERNGAGDRWKTAAGVYSADFVYRAAGTGHFLLRLETDGRLPAPLL